MYDMAIGNLQIDLRGWAWAAIELLQNRRDFATPVKIGEALFSTYLLPFEITSVILLAALVGVVVLHQRQAAHSEQ